MQTNLGRISCLISLTCTWFWWLTFCCSSVAQLCPALCNPMDCSTPGFPALHHLLELAQTYMSVESVMPSNYLILCCPLLLLPSFPESGSFPMSQFFASGGQSIGASASACSSNEYSGLLFIRMDWLDLLQPKGVSRVFFNITVPKHQFFSTQPSLWYNSHVYIWRLEKHSFD